MRTFKSTREQGLDMDGLPMRLFQKAKKWGVWDPRAIDLSQDRIDWQSLSEFHRNRTIRQLSLFLAGEEAVTLDLLPLLRAIAMEGRVEEEMYLTTFLFEEAKHVEFFRRIVDEVVGDVGDLTRFHGPNYRKIFYEFLPQAMERLNHDPSPAAQVEAAVTYNMVVEGILAETGYHSFYMGLGRRNLMPGLLEGITHIKRDESRHIGYGTYLLHRLIRANPELLDVAMQRMQLLVPYALGVMEEDGQADLEPGQELMVDPDEIRAFAARQAQTRMDIIRRAVERPLEEVTEEELGIA